MNDIKRNEPDIDPVAFFITCGVSIAIYLAIKALIFFVTDIIPIILNYLSHIFG
ncbi:MAG: conserved hypothetical protein [Methanobrevibacter sp. CfCl-M3]